jgi:hypothetical protein
MFVPAAQVKDWRDLQTKVCQLFTEMGYEAEVGKRIDLAGRGQKEIDVYVTDPLASYNRIYLIECKHWRRRVKQEVVHAFKSVMEESGSNTGFIVSTVGFQPGAVEAAKYTNINLLDFEQLQHSYGKEWYRKQAALLQEQTARLKLIYALHFDERSQVGIHNNMFFHTPGLRAKLTEFYHRVSSLMLMPGGTEPSSYLGKQPIRVHNNPDGPWGHSGEPYEFATVRDYFRELTRASKECADEFDEINKQAHDSFEQLPDELAQQFMDNTIRGFTDETPLRALKHYVTREEYEVIYQKIANRSRNSS